MSAPRIILDSLPLLYQKLSKFVKHWRSSDRNKFAQLFLRRGVHGQVRWKLQRDSCIFSKCREFLCTNGLKFDSHFDRLTINYAFQFVARLRISKRNSTELCQTRWTVNRANDRPYKSWSRPTQRQLSHCRQLLRQRAGCVLP